MNRNDLYEVSVLTW